MSRAARTSAILLAALLLSACGAAAAPTSKPAPPKTAPAASNTAEPSQAPAARTSRVGGTVRSVASGRVVLADGQSFKLGPKTRVLRLVPVGAAGLKKGDFVAVTAKRQANNVLLASIVNVFPASMRGVGVGQRPMGGGDLMTNATISTIEGDHFTVTFPGGGAHVQLAPRAAVNRFVVATASAIAVGAHVSAFVSGGVARGVTVSPGKS